METLVFDEPGPSGGNRVNWRTLSAANYIHQGQFGGFQVRVGLRCQPEVRPKPAGCCFAGSTCKQVPSLFSGMSTFLVAACMHA